MEASDSEAQIGSNNRIGSGNPNHNNTSLPRSVPIWPTIDGALGLSEEDSVSYARRFYKFGFALLPLLWAVNCFYFWPVLRHAHSFPRIRRCMDFPFFFFSNFIVLNSYSFLANNFIWLIHILFPVAKLLLSCCKIVKS
ncbi:hypothetical protein L6164_012245 [Bauhinia variegata]|uniref:Uncharacterized protein n=1 Tax=Bauhinia variegata TaxID=167791 RepID=A0ACB9PAW9_BAUVA|nr:hypothetical protein L6164_012245 [Bauhinia variegata]